MRLFNGEKRKEKKNCSWPKSDQSLDTEYWFLSCLFMLPAGAAAIPKAQQLECCSGSAVAPGSPLEQHK